MSETETLYCTLGDHDWVRERRRGKKPTACPEHRAEAEEARKAQRVETIAENAATRMIERIEAVMPDVPTHARMSWGALTLNSDREVLEYIARRLSPNGMLRAQKDENGQPESVDHILSVAKTRLRPYEAGRA